VVRLIRLVARVLVDVIAVLYRVGWSGPGLDSLGMNLSRHDKLVNIILKSVKSSTVIVI
jgi:hypothetical protein